MSSVRTNPVACCLKTMTVLAALVVMPSPARADLFDGFEDGDYTSNPPWEVVNLQGTAAVAPDPIGPDEFALRGYGSPAAHHLLATDVAMSWNGFHASHEFLATGESYSSWLSVNDSLEPATQTTLAIHFRHNSDMGNISRFVVVERSESDQILHMQEIPAADVPLNEWLLLSMWHDPGAGLVCANVHPASGGAAIAELSFTPTIADLGSAPPVSVVTIGFEETAWQYIDDVSLVPEPATFVLIALSGLAFLRRRLR